MSLSAYRTWQRVNKTPYSLSTMMAFSCAGPNKEQIRHLRESPHSKFDITVFVSKEGKSAMAHGGRFPMGARIIKEKWNQSTDKVEMSTFMIKRKKGFNPECGDWEFGTLDASGKRVTSRGKLAACMSCHIGQKGKDFTFRTYLDRQ